MIQMGRLLLCFAIPLLLSFGCSSGSKKKIGFLIRSFEMDRCVKERDFFIQRMNELGGESVIADARNDDKLQVEQGIEMLNAGVDVLVIFPVNGLTSALIVREANKRNVKVIAYESLIQDCKLDFFVTANNEKGGELMAKYIVQLVPKGNYVLIGGDKADKNAVLIKTGQHTILDPYVKKGDIKIFYDIYADWNAEDGYNEIMRVINLTDSYPDAIVASNDGLASGISQALVELGFAGKIPLTGLDGELSAFQRIAKGTQSMTVFKPFKKQAFAAAEIAFKLANNAEPENITAEVFNGAIKVPTYLVEPIVIDKNNIGEIIKEGVFTEKEIYTN